MRPREIDLYLEGSVSDKEYCTQHKHMQKVTNSISFQDK